MCLNMWGHMVELKQGRLKLKIVLGLGWPCTQVSVADVSIFSAHLLHHLMSLPCADL